MRGGGAAFWGPPPQFAPPVLSGPSGNLGLKVHQEIPGEALLGPLVPGWCGELAVQPESRPPSLSRGGVRRMAESGLDRPSKGPLMLGGGCWQGGEGGAKGEWGPGITSKYVLISPSIHPKSNFDDPDPPHSPPEPPNPTLILPGCQIPSGSPQEAPSGLNPLPKHSHSPRSPNPRSPNLPPGPSVSHSDTTKPL